MKYLLDTNAIIAIMKGQEAFMKKLKRHAPADFGMPGIVLHELYYGAYRSQRIEHNLQRIEALRFEVLDLDREDGRRAAQLRAELASHGTPIGAYDVLIAGQTLARDLTLITHNRREFQRVPQLKVQDWEA